MRITTSVVLFLAFSFLAANVALAKEKPFSLDQGVVYAEVDGQKLQLDVVVPSPARGNYPTIVFIAHPADPYRTTFTMDMLNAARRGFVAVAVGYRSIDEEESGRAKYLLPAQVLDIKRALCWLSKHADRYHIDDTRVGLTGWSIAGWMALMAGFSAGEETLRPGECTRDPRVRAIVSLAGNVDLSKMRPADSAWLLGGSAADIPRAYESCNPLHYLSEDDPPVLIIHGKNDAISNPQESILLAENLDEKRIPHQLMLLENVGHMDVLNHAGSDFVWDFWDKHLGQN